MNITPLYQQLLDLFALTDTLRQRIEQNDDDARSYFATLVAVENIFDGYGRGLVRRSAIEAGKSEQEASELAEQANSRMAELRVAIRKIVQAGDYDDLLKAAGAKMYEDWHKLPEDHPNAASWQN